MTTARWEHPTGVTMRRGVGSAQRRFALCWAAAGLLLLPLVGHPDIFEVPFSHAALTSWWVTAHTLLVVALVLTLYGLAGLHARRAGLGPTGALGLALVVPGAVCAAIAGGVEAFVMPVLARQQPGLLAWDGPLLASWPLRVSGVLALLWPAGLCLVGIGAVRGGALPKRIALTLAVSSAAFIAFTGPFVPVLGVAAASAFCLAQVWVGHELWTRVEHRSLGERPALGEGCTS